MRFVLVILSLVCLDGCFPSAQAARETPVYDPTFPPVVFHTGREPKLPVYYGKGADRQILIFCMHVTPENTNFADVPVHIVHAFDDPEKPAEPAP